MNCGFCETMANLWLALSNKETKNEPFQIYNFTRVYKYMNQTTMVTVLPLGKHGQINVNFHRGVMFGGHNEDIIANYFRK